MLATYARGTIYTDCFATSTRGACSLQRLVGAFYTTPLFRLERLVLTWAFGKPSSDADVGRLADGAAETFAAWRVEARAEGQLLLSDYRGRTRSWLMVAPLDERPAATRLYFGSAVLPASNGPSFPSGLMRLHRLYSVMLLASARRRLDRRAARPSAARGSAWKR